MNYELETAYDIRFKSTITQWRSQVFESGGTRKARLIAASQVFHEHRTREFGGESGDPVFTQKKKLNLGLAEMRLPAVLSG